MRRPCGKRSDVPPKGLPVTETVDLSTDEELAAFVTRLLDLDPEAREDLRAGRKRFWLAVPQNPQGPQAPQAPPVNRLALDIRVLCAAWGAWDQRPNGRKWFRRPASPPDRTRRGDREGGAGRGAGRPAACARPPGRAHPAGQGPGPGQRRRDNGAFLEVEAEGSGQRLIASDVLGSGVGERVLVAQGSVAAAVVPRQAAARRRADHRLHRPAPRDPSRTRQKGSQRWRITRSD